MCKKFWKHSIHVSTLKCLYNCIISLLKPSKGSLLLTEQNRLRLSIHLSHHPRVPFLECVRTFHLGAFGYTLPSAQDSLLFNHWDLNSTITSPTPTIVNYKGLSIAWYLVDNTDWQGCRTQNEFKFTASEEDKAERETEQERERERKEGRKEKEGSWWHSCPWSHHPKVKSTPVLINNLFIWANTCDLIWVFLTNQ